MADYGQPETYTAKRSNGLGLAGFITSLVGLASCGIISPLALLLSFFGMFKSPRGFALAGFVLGGLGTLWIAFVTAMTGAIVGAPMFSAFNIPEVSTGARIVMSLGLVEEYRKQHGDFPNLDAWQNMTQTAWFKTSDGWGEELQYSLDEEGNVEIRSAGPDGEFNTDDDMTSTQFEEELELDEHSHGGHDHGEHGEHSHAEAKHDEHSPAEVGLDGTAHDEAKYADDDNADHDSHKE